MKAKNISKEGYGSAIDSDALIPTPEGVVRMGDLKKGDYVLDQNGKPIEVLEVLPRGKCVAYEIKFDDGRRVCSGESNVWTYYADFYNNYYSTVSQTTKYLLESPRKQGYRILAAGPAEHTTKDFRIPPYAAGAFAGAEWCLDKPVTVMTNSKSIVKKIASVIPEVVEEPKEKQPGRWIFPLKEPFFAEPKLKIVNLSTTRYLGDYYKYRHFTGWTQLPEEYLYGDVDQRMELLRGLLDTRGKIEPGKGNLTFIVDDEPLSKQFWRLCHGLGILTGTAREMKTTSGNIRYVVNVSCEREEKQNLFSCDEKKEVAQALQPSTVKKYYDRIKIAEINKLPEFKEMTGIIVDNPDGLYLVNDYIVSHDASPVVLSYSRKHNRE